MNRIARVRKHRAPKGALRPSISAISEVVAPLRVRKHRAPKGALRRVTDDDVERFDHAGSESTERQKVH